MTGRRLFLLLLQQQRLHQLSVDHPLPLLRQRVRLVFRLLPPLLRRAISGGHPLLLQPPTVSASAEQIFDHRCDRMSVVLLLQQQRLVAIA